MTKINMTLPAYNKADVINRAIRSVRNQTLEDFELIIVDNCSNDETVDIASSYEDSRIEVVEHSNNKGAARNTKL